MENEKVVSKDGNIKSINFIHSNAKRTRRGLKNLIWRQTSWVNTFFKPLIYKRLGFSMTSTPVFFTNLLFSKYIKKLFSPLLTNRLLRNPFSLWSVQHEKLKWLSNDSISPRGCFIESQLFNQNALNNQNFAVETWLKIDFALPLIHFKYGYIFSPHVRFYMSLGSSQCVVFITKVGCM